MSSTHPGNDASSMWWLDPTPSRPNGVTTTGGRPTIPHLTHLTSNLFTRLTFSHRWHPRPVQRHPPSDLVPPSCPHGHSPLIFHPLYPPLLQLTLFFHLKKTRPLRLSVCLLFHLFSLLIWAASPRPRPRPVLSLRRSGTRRLGRLFMHGVRPVVPPTLLRDSLPSQQPEAVPFVLPTCSAPVPTAAPAREH